MKKAEQLPLFLEGPVTVAGAEAQRDILSLNCALFGNEFLKLLNQVFNENRAQRIQDVSLGQSISLELLPNSVFQSLTNGRDEADNMGASCQAFSDLRAAKDRPLFELDGGFRDTG